MDHPDANTREQICLEYPVFLIRACSDVLDSLDKEAVLFPVLSLKEAEYDRTYILVGLLG